MSNGTCFCGAHDCPYCYPGSCDWITCADCGITRPRWMMQLTEYGAWLCEECVNANADKESRENMTNDAALRQAHAAPNTAK